MNTPVNFEIAKLLKEKGFDEQWNIHMYRPTIADVVMWLYEKHGIWIYADSHEFGKWCYYYRFNRPHELSPRITENGQFSLEDYNSPTEAYEAAIEYTLNNLI